LVTFLTFKPTEVDVATSGKVELVVPVAVNVTVKSPVLITVVSLLEKVWPLKVNVNKPGTVVA
jgi:hypothetical protein